MIIAISLAVLLAFSWLYMQWTHEAGHVLAGLASDAKIDRVSLDPRTFSMTRFRSTPRPLVAAWGGPLLGSVIGAGFPLVLICFLRQWRFSLSIIGAFVLLANGLYIGIGAAMPVGDAQSLVMFGTPRWLLALFGVACLFIARVMLRPVLRSEVVPPARAQAGVFTALTIALALTGLVVFPHITNS